MSLHHPPPTTPPPGPKGAWSNRCIGLLQFRSELFFHGHGPLDQSIGRSNREYANHLFAQAAHLKQSLYPLYCHLRQAHQALFGPPPSLILMSIMVIMMVMVVSPENMKVVEEVAKVSGWVRDSPTHTGWPLWGRYVIEPFHSNPLQFNISAVDTLQKHSDQYLVGQLLLGRW